MARGTTFGDRCPSLFCALPRLAYCDAVYYRPRPQSTRLWKLRASAAALQMVICGDHLCCLDCAGGRLIVTLALSSTKRCHAGVDERNLMVTNRSRVPLRCCCSGISRRPLVGDDPLLAASDAIDDDEVLSVRRCAIGIAGALCHAFRRCILLPALWLAGSVSAVAVHFVFGFGLLLEKIGYRWRWARTWRNSGLYHALEANIETV